MTPQKFQQQVKDLATRTSGHQLQAEYVALMGLALTEAGYADGVKEIADQLTEQGFRLKGI